MLRVVIGSKEYRVPDNIALEMERQIVQDRRCTLQGYDFDQGTQDMLKRAADSLYESDEGIELLTQLETMYHNVEIVFGKGHSITFQIVPPRRSGPDFDIECLTYGIDQDSMPPFMYQQMRKYYQEVDARKLLQECYFCEDHDFDAAYDYARSQCRKLYLGVRNALYKAMEDELGISKGVRYDQAYITMLLDGAYDIVRKERLNRAKV
jgi:hypothetical protein